MLAKKIALARRALPLAAALATAVGAAFAAPGASPTPTPTLTPTISPTPKAPVFILDPIPQRANVGQTIKFFGEVEVPPPPAGGLAPKDHIPGGIEYVWNKNNELIDGATTNSLTLGPVTANDEAEYNCQATNAGGTATSANARLIVNDPAVLNESTVLSVSFPAQMTVNSTVACNVQMCNTSKVTWSAPQGYRLAVVSDPGGFMQGAEAIPFASEKDVVPALGGIYFFFFNIKAPATPGQRTLQFRMAENDTLFPDNFFNRVSVTINVMSAPPTATPSFTPTASLTPSATPTPTLTPSPHPPTINREPADLSANAGQSVKFFSGAFEPAAPGAPKGLITYQWLKQGTPIPGKTESSLTLADIDATDAAQYNCQATNGGGTTSSRLATLTVHNPAKPNLAELLGHSAPAQMFLGQSLYVGVTIRNTSEVSWTKTQGYSLAAVSDADALLQGATRFHFNAESDVVAPLGGIYNFVALVTAPATPGTYTAQLRMIEEFAGTPLFGPTVSITIEAIALPNDSADWAIYE